MHSIKRQFALGPVWLLTLILKPALPASHPWKRQRMTLASWAERGTSNAYTFSFMFWLQLLAMPVVAWTIFTR